MFRFLRHILRHDAGNLSLAGLAILVAALNIVAIGWGLRYLIDHGFAEGRADYLNAALLALLGFVTVQAVATFTRFYLVNRSVERAVADLRARIYAKIVTLEAAYFDGQPIGALISRLNADTTLLQSVLSQSVPVAIRNVFLLAGTFAMLVMTNAELLLYVALAIPVVVVPIVVVGRKVKHRSRTAQDKLADLASYADETLHAISTLRAFGRETHAAAAYLARTHAVRDEGMRYIFLRALLTAFVIFIVFGAVGLVLWHGGHQVIAGDMTAGELSSFIFYAVLLTGAVGALSEEISAVNRASGAIARIDDILDMPSSRQGGIMINDRVSGHIVFNDVSFAYPSRPDAPVLVNVGFEVMPGETVAIVGPSGSGKTTLFSLLQGAYTPSAGAVRVDGHDIAALDLTALRQHIALVAQEPVLFDAGIAENVRFGLRDSAMMNDAAIADVLKSAQIYDFVSALPQGIHTNIGPRGSQLSVGQKQRIAIARALARDAEILLLDEATSALDAESESAVKKALSALKQGRTTLIIAHRLATVRQADRIIVMDKGRIIDVGTHDALMAKGGVYARLAALQLME